MAAGVLQQAIRTRQALAKMVVYRAKAAERERAAAAMRLVRDKRARRQEQLAAAAKPAAIALSHFDTPKWSPSSAFVTADKASKADPSAYAPATFATQFASTAYTTKYSGKLSAVRDPLNSSFAKHPAAGKTETEIAQISTLLLQLSAASTSTAHSLQVLLCKLISICRKHESCAANAYFFLVAQLTDATLASSSRVWIAFSWLAASVPVPSDMLPFVLAALNRCDTPVLSGTAQHVHHFIGWTSASGGRAVGPAEQEMETFFRSLTAHLSLALPPAKLDLEPYAAQIVVTCADGTVVRFATPLHARASRTSDAVAASLNVPTWLRGDFGLCIETQDGVDDWLNADDFVWDVIALRAAASEPFALSFKRRLFTVDELSRPLSELPDNVAHMLVSQLSLHYLAGRYGCTAEDAKRGVALLAAISIESAGIIVADIEAHLPSIVRACVPRDHFDQHSVDEWVAASKSAKTMSGAAARRGFLELVHGLKHYGASFCPVHVGARKAVVIVDSNGLEVVGASSKQAIWNAKFDEMEKRKMDESGKLVIELSDRSTVSFKTEEHATRAMLNIMEAYSPAAVASA